MISFHPRQVKLIPFYVKSGIIKKSIETITEQSKQSNIYNSIGFLFLGACLSALIAIITGSVTSAKFVSHV